MANIAYSYEKMVAQKPGGLVNQRIDFTCNVTQPADVDDLGYNDFSALLFINDKLITDISPVLGSIEQFKDIIDSIPWKEVATDFFSSLKTAAHE